MGGYEIVLMETSKHRLMMKVSLSYDTPRANLYAENKETDEADWDSGELAEKMFEQYPTTLMNVLDEIEKEQSTRACFRAMTAEQITLSDMYERMSKAEDTCRYLRRENDQMRDVLKQLDETIKLIERNNRTKA